MDYPKDPEAFAWALSEKLTHAYGVRCPTSISLPMLKQYRTAWLLIGLALGLLAGWISLLALMAIIE